MSDIHAKSSRMSRILLVSLIGTVFLGPNHTTHAYPRLALVQGAGTWIVLAFGKVFTRYQFGSAGD